MSMNIILSILFILTIFSLLIKQINCQQKKEGQHQKQHIPTIGLCIAFIFGSLLYGGFLKMISRKTYIPYNPMLLFSGLLFGKYHTQFPSFIANSVRLVSQLNPHGILAIFLPPIIFTSAFKVEWHLFRKQSAQTLILGVPSVLISSILIMLSIKFIIKDSNFTWIPALLLGTVLSCTDIFSFVSKLMEQGTPKKIIGLIQGESLFNYCTCVMVFQILNELIMDDQYTYFGLLTIIIQQIFGGILFGSLFAWITIYWLRRMAYDGVLVVSVMIISCYTIYIVAQFTQIPISGICALVSFGILMAGFGRSQLSKETNQYVTGFWKYIVFSAQTNIFFIAGVMVGANVVALRQQIDSAFDSTVLLLYLLVLLSRFTSIALFIKWLAKFGYGMQWKQAIVVSSGGLKGAIGISFAMIIFQNKGYNEDMRDMFLLYVTGNSILTMLINSILTRALIKFLGVSTLTKVQYKFFKEFLVQFKKSIRQQIDDLKNDKFLELVDWAQVQNKVGIPQYTRLQEKINTTIDKIKEKSGTRFQKRQLYKLQSLLREFTTKNTTNVVQCMAQNQFNKQIQQFDTIVQIRKRFIKNLIQKYWQYHLSNHTSPAAIRILLQSAYFDLDTQTQQLGSWQWIKTQISQPYIRFLSQLRRNKIMGWIARTYLFDYIFYCYDVVSSYVEAHQQVSKQFRQSTILTVDQSSIDLILNQGAENQRQAQVFLVNYLKPSFPQIQTELKTKKASFNLLFTFKSIIDRFQQTGQLQANQYEMLNTLVIQKTLTLQLHSPKWTITPFTQMYKNDQVFGLLPQKILQVLEESLSEYQTYDSNEFIINQSTICKYFYFIRRGSCTIEYSNLQHSIYKSQLTVGDVFGIQTLVSPIHQSNVVANAMVIVLRVKKVCIQKIMDTFPQFQEHFWKKYLFYFYKMFYHKKNYSFHFNNLEKQEFAQALHDFRLVKMEKGSYQIKQDTIFLRGYCQIAVSEYYQEPLQNSNCQQKQIQKEKQKEVTISKISPMTILSSQQYDQRTVTLLVRQKSSFFCGNLPFQLRALTDSKVPSLVFKTSFHEKENNSSRQKLMVSQSPLIKKKPLLSKFSVQV